MISRFFASTKDPQPTRRNLKPRISGSDARRRSERISRHTHQHLSNAATSSFPPIDLSTIPFLGFGQRGPRPASRELHDFLSSATSARRQQKLHGPHPTGSVLSWSTSPKRPSVPIRHRESDVGGNSASCPSPRKKPRTPSHQHLGRAKYNRLVHRAENEHKSIVSATVLSSESKENHPPGRHNDATAEASIRNDEKTIKAPGANPDADKPETFQRREAPQKRGSSTIREPGDQPYDVSKQKSPKDSIHNAGPSEDTDPAKGMAGQNAQVPFTEALGQLVDNWKDKVTIPADVIENLRRTGYHQDGGLQQIVRAASPQQHISSEVQATQTAAEPPQSLPTPPLVSSAEAPPHQAALCIGQFNHQDGPTLPQEPTIGTLRVRGERALPLDLGPHRPFQAHTHPAYGTWQTTPSIYERQMSAELPQETRRPDIQRMNPQIGHFAWSARQSVPRVYGTPQSLESAFNQPHWTNHAREQFTNSVAGQVYDDDYYRDSVARDSSLNQYLDIGLQPELHTERSNVLVGSIGSPYRHPEEFHFLAEPDDTMADYRRSHWTIPNLCISRDSDSAKCSNIRRALTSARSEASPLWNRVDQKTLHEPDDVQVKTLAGFWRPNMLY